MSPKKKIKIFILGRLILYYYAVTYGLNDVVLTTYERLQFANRKKKLRQFCFSLSTDVSKLISGIPLDLYKSDMFSQKKKFQPSYLK